jgi:hypothetical protein
MSLEILDEEIDNTAATSQRDATNLPTEATEGNDSSSSISWDVKNGRKPKRLLMVAEESKCLLITRALDERVLLASLGMEAKSR